MKGTRWRVIAIAIVLALGAWFVIRTVATDPREEEARHRGRIVQICRKVAEALRQDPSLRTAPLDTLVERHILTADDTEFLRRNHVLYSPVNPEDPIVFQYHVSERTSLLIRLSGRSSYADAD